MLYSGLYMCSRIAWMSQPFNLYLWKTGILAFFIINMLVEHSKNSLIVSHRLVIYEVFLCSTNILHGFSAFIIHQMITYLILFSQLKKGKEEEMYLIACTCKQYLFFKLISNSFTSNI